MPFLVLLTIQIWTVYAGGGESQCGYSLGGNGGRYEPARALCEGGTRDVLAVAAQRSVAVPPQRGQAGPGNSDRHEHAPYGSPSVAREIAARLKYSRGSRCLTSGMEVLIPHGRFRRLSLVRRCCASSAADGKKFARNIAAGEGFRNGISSSSNDDRLHVNAAAVDGRPLTLSQVHELREALSQNDFPSKVFRYLSVGAEDDDQWGSQQLAYRRDPDMNGNGGGTSFGSGHDRRLDGNGRSQVSASDFGPDAVRREMDRLALRSKGPIHLQGQRHWIRRGIWSFKLAAAPGSGSVLPEDIGRPAMMKRWRCVQILQLLPQALSVQIADDLPADLLPSFLGSLCK